MSFLLPIPPHSWMQRTQIVLATCLSLSLCAGTHRAEQPVCRAEIYPKASPGGIQFHTGAAGGKPGFLLDRAPFHPVRVKFVVCCSAGKLNVLRMLRLL